MNNYIVSFTLASFIQTCFNHVSSSEHSHPVSTFPCHHFFISSRCKKQLRMLWCTGMATEEGITEWLCFVPGRDGGRKERERSKNDESCIRCKCGAHSLQTILIVSTSETCQQSVGVYISTDCHLWHVCKSFVLIEIIRPQVTWYLWSWPLNKKDLKVSPKLCSCPSWLVIYILPETKMRINKAKCHSTRLCKYPTSHLYTSHQKWFLHPNCAIVNPMIPFDGVELSLCPKISVSVLSDKTTTTTLCGCWWPSMTMIHQ